MLNVTAKALLALVGLTSFGYIASAAGPGSARDLHAALLKEKGFSGKMQDLRQAVYEALPPELKAAGGDDFAGDLLTAFFTHDGAFTLREFHRPFEGTSGMVLATSLQPGEQFISANNQTMAVALDPSAAAPVYLSSDPSALRAALLEDGRAPQAAPNQLAQLRSHRY